MGSDGCLNPWANLPVYRLNGAFMMAVEPVDGDGSDAVLWR